MCGFIVCVGKECREKSIAERGGGFGDFSALVLHFSHVNGFRRALTMKIPSRCSKRNETQIIKVETIEATTRASNISSMIDADKQLH